MKVRYVLVIVQVVCTAMALAQTSQKSREALLLLSMFFCGAYLGSIVFDRVLKGGER